MAATVSRWARRRYLNRLFSLALALVVGLALVVAWVRVAQTLLRAPDHKPPIGNVTSVVWNGRVFTTSSQLRAFLESRGLSYARWVRAHPYAFTGKRAPVAARTERTTRSGHKLPSHRKIPAVAASPARAAPPSAGQGYRSIVATSVTVLLVLVAVALGLAATVFARFVPRLARGIHLDLERRFTLFAAGIAILFGVLVARLMS